MFVCLSKCPHHPDGVCQAQPDLLPHTPGTGWWFCQMKTKRGWVPASYLEPLDSPDESEDPEPNYAGAPPAPVLHGHGVWEEGVGGARGY